MCELSKEVVSCQLQFLTLGSNEISKDVEKVLKIIEKSKLEYEVGEMTTLIKGKYIEVFKLLEEITKITMETGNKFVINTIISNECGC